MEGLKRDHYETLVLNFGMLPSIHIDENPDHLHGGLRG